MKINITELAVSLVKLSMTTQTIKNLPQTSINDQTVCCLSLTDKDFVVKDLVDILNNLIRLFPQEANIEYFQENKE